MGNPKLDDFLLFSKVVEMKNFSKTAEQRGMVKSMISKRISRLEKQLGVRLLHRSTRSMSLTEYGATLYEYTQRIEEEVNDAVEAMTLGQHQPKGRLKVVVPHSFGDHYLSQLVANFVEQFPDLHVEIELSAAFPNLQDSGFDLVIHVGDPPATNDMSKLIGWHRYVVCASKDYFKRQGCPNSIYDLQRHNCLIQRNLPNSNVWSFQHQKKRHHVTINGNFVSNSPQSLKHAAMSGLGIVMLPDYMVKTEVADGALQAIFQDYCPEDIGLYAVFPYTKHISPKLRVFLEFLSKNL